MPLKTRIKNGVEQGTVIIFGLALLAAYAALLIVPVAGALFATDALVGGVDSLAGITVYVALTIVFSGVAVAFGHAVGMLDFENATGRVPGSRY